MNGTTGIPARCASGVEEEAALEIRPLTEALSVSSQIELADLGAVVVAGFRSVLCNRPDGEAEGQVSLDDLASAARREGLPLTFAYLPVVSGGVTREDGRRFGELLARLPKPVLAYCRSGARSASLWGLSQCGKMPRAQILERAARAGFGLNGLLPPDGTGGPPCMSS
jgi:sulfide:quinone oxidoreductase